MEKYKSNLRSRKLGLENRDHKILEDVFHVTTSLHVNALDTYEPHVCLGIDDETIGS